MKTQAVKNYAGSPLPALRKTLSQDRGYDRALYLL